MSSIGYCLIDISSWSRLILIIENSLVQLYVLVWLFPPFTLQIFLFDSWLDITLSLKRAAFKCISYAYRLLKVSICIATLTSNLLGAIVLSHLILSDFPVVQSNTEI